MLRQQSRFCVVLHQIVPGNHFCHALNFDCYRPLSQLRPVNPKPKKPRLRPVNPEVHVRTDQLTVAPWFEQDLGIQVGAVVRVYPESLLKRAIWGFPKLRVTFLVVPIIRTILFWLPAGLRTTAIVGACKLLFPKKLGAF